ncbi:MAG: DUF5803 family protein [Methanoregula sp.]
MRTPDRDQRRSSLAALCAALVILLVFVPPIGALSADYRIFPNGTAYQASIEINDTSRYEFAEIGFMGENVPLAVGWVNLTANGMPVEFNRSTAWGRPQTITFPKGNYTVSYIAPLKDNHLQGVFEKPYHVNVTIPQEFNVQNPLLAGLSTGANVTRFGDNTTLVQWNRSFGFDLRFYDETREQLLYFFLQFMGILVVVLVVIPYFLTMKRSE